MRRLTSDFYHGIHGGFSRRAVLKLVDAFGSTQFCSNIPAFRGKPETAASCPQSVRQLYLKCYRHRESQCSGGRCRPETAIELYRPSTFATCRSLRMSLLKRLSLVASSVRMSENTDCESVVSSAIENLLIS